MTRTNYLLMVGATKGGHPIFRAIMQDGDRYFVKYNNQIMDATEDFKTRKNVIKNIPKKDEPATDQIKTIELTNDEIAIAHKAFQEFEFEIKEMGKYDDYKLVILKQLKEKMMRAYYNKN